MKPRELVHDLVGQARRKLTGRCAYCGTHCYGRTCPAHRDLPQLEAQAAAPDRATTAANHTPKGA